MSTRAGDSAYALLTDGTTIEIRPAQPGDFDAVRDMHGKMSSDNLYLRFFSMGTAAAEREARRICREPGPDREALLAVLDGEVVGCGSYELLGAGSQSAEVAMAVADDIHNRGVGTLLLEHLVSLARGRGVRAFTAQTLSENALMLQVFADSGLRVQRALADGVYDLTFPLPSGEANAALGTYRDAVAERERSADLASLRYVLTPASVAVIGASRGAGVGRAGHPAEHHHRGLLRPGLRSEPGRGRAGRRAAACRQRPRSPSLSTWQSSPYRRGPCSVSPKNAGSGGSRRWS